MKTLREIYTQYIEFRKAGGKVITKDSYQPLKNMVYFVENKKKTPYLNQHLFREWINEHPRTYNVMTIVHAFLEWAKEENLLHIYCAKPKYKRAPKTKSVLDTPLEKSIISDMLTRFVKWRKSTQPLNRQYHYHLVQFNNYCNEEWPEATEISNDIIGRWCKLNGSESALTRNTRCYPIIRFVEYGIANGWKGIKVPELLPVGTRFMQGGHAFTRHELEEFFSRCDNLRQYPNEPERDFKIRALVNPVLFRFLYSTGVRICEALALESENVDLEKGVITIIEYFRHAEHKIALSASMQCLLKRYNDSIEKAFPNRDAFFINRLGQHLSSAAVEKNFQKIWITISDISARPADFRFTYAVENIKKWNYEGTEWNSELLFLSRSMGHTEIRVTERYLSHVPQFAKTLSDLTSENLRKKLPDLNKFTYNEEEKDE